MQIKTNIAKAVEEVSNKAKYDNEVKKILSDPQILAWILKYTVEEFKEYDIPEIISCIEGAPTPKPMMQPAMVPTPETL